MKRALPGLLLAVLATTTLLAQTDFHNGDWLAYVLNGDVWVQSFPIGTPQQVSHGGEAGLLNWNPSHQLIYQQKSKTIVVPGGEDASSDAAARSRIQSVLRTGPKTEVPQLQRSPDGKRFAAVVASDPYGSHRSPQLFLVNADGSNPEERYMPAGWANIFLAGWTPDSRFVLFWVDDDFSASVAADGLPLMSLPADGGKAIELSSETLTYGDFIITSPLRHEILLVAGGDRQSWTNKRLLLADPATGHSVPLTGRQTAVAGAAWSPDGEQIAFIAGPDDAHDATITKRGQTKQVRVSGDYQTLPLRRLWIMNSDGTQKQQLTHDADYRDEHPFWSNDGRYIVFIRFGPQLQASVWTIEVRSGKTSRVVERIDSPGVGYYGHPNWPLSVTWPAK